MSEIARERMSGIAGEGAVEDPAVEDPAGASLHLATPMPTTAPATTATKSQMPFTLTS
jgi:hypothetical protein